MRVFEIDNIKKFTSSLFVGNAFDDFLVTEASFSTLTNITIDGHMNKEFMGEAELAMPKNRDMVIGWRALKPLCYNIIKGQKVPLRFKIIFMMPTEVVLKFLDDEGLDFEPVEINALFLNVKFENGKLTCTTGTSMKIFTLDKSLEDAWECRMMRFLDGVQK